MADKHSERYKVIDFSPPRDMKETSAQALRDMNSLDRPLNVELPIDKYAVEVAHQIAELPELPVATVHRMLHYFDIDDEHNNAHQNADEGTDGNIIWRLWGGDPGKKWAVEIEEDMAVVDSNWYRKKDKWVHRS